MDSLVEDVQGAIELCTIRSIDNSVIDRFESEIATNGVKGDDFDIRSYFEQQTKHHLAQLRGKNVPPGVFELHLIQIVSNPELLRRLLRITTRLESPVGPRDVEVSLQPLSDPYIHDSASPSPRFDRASGEAAPTAARSKPSSHQPGVVDTVNNVVTSDEEEDEPDDLDPQESDDQRDREFDQEVLPRTVPGWVRHAGEIADAQQGWSVGQIFGPPDAIDYLPENSPGHSSLFAPDKRQSLTEHAMSGSISCPSSPPILDRSNVDPYSHTTPSLTNEPDEGFAPASTPCPRQEQRPNPMVRRYPVRANRLALMTKSGSQIQNTENGLYLLGKPPRRKRAKKKNSQNAATSCHSTEVGRRQQNTVELLCDLPVCEQIRLSYAPHPEIPVRIVNSSHGRGKRFDPMQLDGKNERAIHKHDIHVQVAKWRQDWEEIPFELDDARVFEGIRGHDISINALCTSVSEARSPLDVVRALSSRAFKADQHSIYLELLHLCTIRVCTYWEPDEVEAGNLRAEFQSWTRDKEKAILTLLGICARLPRKEWWNRQWHLAVILLGKSFGTEKLKEWFRASDRPFVFSQFLAFLRERGQKMTYTPELLTTDATSSSRPMPILDTIKALFANVLEISPEQIEEALAYISAEEKVNTTSAVLDRCPTQPRPERPGAKRPARYDASSPSSKRKRMDGSNDSGIFDCSQFANDDMTEILLNTEVNRFIRRMQGVGKRIQTDIHAKSRVDPYCGSSSFQLLSAKNRFDENLLHCLISTTGVVNASTLGTIVYADLQQDNWATDTGWVQDLPRKKNRWLIPIQDGDHWQAVQISWSAARILCYNPVRSADAEKRSTHVLKTMKEWFRTIETGPCKIATSLQRGPSVDEANPEESGPFVALMIQSWRVGQRVTSRDCMTGAEARNKLLQVATGYVAKEGVS